MTASTGFWTRRKAAVAAEEQAETAARDAAERQAHEQALAERPDAELLAEAGMPEPETLTTAEEVQDFLKTALPQRLKARALRRLWRLNPVLANLDGLVDYGEDYTDATRVIENMQTVYQVGKGMFDKFAEPDPEPEPEEEPLLAEAEEETPEEVAPEDEPDTPYSYTFTDTDDTEPAPAANTRRMRFRFETEETA
ncbi:DUF3306 domain-containing protein [Roseovarius sp.]|uniref:DUF3306 domain-containing protein n=1 Tax=Roseovarius sp. TaxID=1486281 RepID=UPI00262A4B79|nr:DUF3306 domain-containing protein [Roseovarius sp.]MDM8165938.1 DUF3306 domain-containing protein [Roseovarius sp.]